MKSSLNFIQLVKDEFHAFFHCKAAMLIVFAGVIFYSLLYNVLYMPNVVRDTPVVIVDHSQTFLSRSLIRAVKASSHCKVVSQESNIEHAKRLFIRQEAEAILQIPKSFEKELLSNRQTSVEVYASTRSFLYYSAIVKTISGAISEIQDFTNLKSYNNPKLNTPIKLISHNLYNKDEGYGNYLIPEVLVLILFQTLLIGIGMVSVNRNKAFADSTRSYSNWAIIQIIAARSICFMTVYILLSCIALGIIPSLFKLPAIGNQVQIFAFIIPFLFSTSMLGIALGSYFKDEESTMLAFVFASLPWLLLAGTSYPLELIPYPWKAMHYAMPATITTLNFVKMNAMGASLYQVREAYCILWIQSIVYFILAFFIIKAYIKKNMPQKR
ncbi:ABC transporter permease [Aureibacter tunicatorum]|uniref:ABC-2 type transport system permease protein n=1 Tax=Aureibacter tunicatorum TaxID=866807 RepID=A0AAE3XLN9_9BACT|nr:ABC transporter permease [Aureibacter tunicatorum]MDR6238230.1 ABC-2 type transport system permease protein [Aureibacter tunicatorum]